MREGRSVSPPLYAVTAVVSIVAATALFWNGRAAYHHIQASADPVLASEIAAIFWSVVVLQIAYWSVLRRQAPYSFPKNFLMASIMIFFSRLSFMLAGALFSIVIFVRFGQIDIGPLGYLRFAIVLFTIFCFSRWLESLGRAFETGAQTPGENPRIGSRTSAGGKRRSGKRSNLT
jgi:hypothetical protein